MKSLNLNVKSFISSLIVIFALMILCYILTFIIPGGEYARVLDASGNLILDTNIPFKYIEGGIPFYKWLLSPFLVLTAEGSSTIIAVIAFLLVIGGIFNVLNSCKMIEYMLEKLVNKYGKYKYKLMAVMILLFMLLGAFVGSFEEVVPLTPIVVALAIALGWDAFTGISMSLIAVGFGFSTGVMNPFTVGVAQKLAGIAMFSGIWLRIVAFIPIYLLLLLFTYKHAKKVEKPVNYQAKTMEVNINLDNAIKAFGLIILVGIILIISSTFITVLQDYTLIIVAIMFLVAGIVSAIFAKVKFKTFITCFAKGVLTMLPAVLMILMASSIKYTLSEAKILDTIMHGVVGIADNIPNFLVIILIYLLVLIFNFFIASGSAKAFLLIPLIVPIAPLFNISPQLCILAFAFGDGFSNVFYPTNPALLISLGVSNIDYPSYAKSAWKLQLSNFALTCVILLFGLLIGY